ncbi:MAG: acyl-CoA thioesterase [Rhodobacteraceae bacterium]|nr:acyl-CoA thioesterase [Paracoccaceae bacterium]
MADRIEVLPLEAFPTQVTENIRYGDTDRQGHVNNAVYATYFESGRVDLLHDSLPLLEASGCQFVIARLIVDYVREMHWPGTPVIGTGVLALGRSSATLRQAVFQDGICTAIAENVIVLMDMKTRRARELPEMIRSDFERLKLVAAS